MKIDLALRRAHASESELADALLRIGERHKADHDVFHVSRTLAKIARHNLARLAGQAERYDLSLDTPGDEADHGGLLATVREKGAELVGRRPETGVLLVRDLRELHLRAAAASIDWVILGQGAQAVKDAELLEAVSDCHAGTLRTLKWTVTRIKEGAPQALAS